MKKNETRAGIKERAVDEARVRKLAASVVRRAPLDAVNVLIREEDEVVARVLSKVDPALALKILIHFPEERAEFVVQDVTSRLAEQWAINQDYPEDTVGRLMDRPVAVFGMGTTVRGAIERIRELAEQRVMPTYAYVTDEEERLQGVVVMRDLLFADSNNLLIDVMVAEPFYFSPETPVQQAMLAVVHRHYPVYPVCDDAGRLVGLVQGYVLFEQHAIEVSAQPGRMVGVESEEHLATPLVTCFKYRHPWLQLNLLTAFLAAFVVGLFEETIQRVVVLAAFLPVLAGQSGNTGCQALAVTLRGITLGEVKRGFERKIVRKEATLGLLNGALVGVTAGAGMLLYAWITGTGALFLLALVVFIAMLGSCVLSGISGVVIPLMLQRVGADPATASTIFLTTATDVVSMGLLLGLASVLVL